MAALQGQVQFGAGASVALTGGTAKTPVVVTAPANQRLKIMGYGFFFDGTSNWRKPVQVEIQRASAAGTSTGRDAAAQRGGPGRDLPVGRGGRTPASSPPIPTP